MRRVSVFLMVLGLLLPAAAAQAQDIMIEIGDARGEPGEVIVITEVPVDPAFVGLTCDGNVTTTNNISVHLDNDLIIETGGQVAEVPNYEREANLVLDIPGTLVLGDTITLSVRFGPDGITSGGATLTLDCSQPPETTTTTAAPTTTTTPPDPTTTTVVETTTTVVEPTTTAPSTSALGGGGNLQTTTTVSAPTGGVATGAGGTAGPGQAGFAALAIALALLAGAGTAFIVRRRPGA